jgi:multidrug efflux system membrane fusion protein
VKGSTPGIPVTVAAVTKEDFPVYLVGLGTVQGFNTVTVRTRVDGQTQSDCLEGQFVKEGDLVRRLILGPPGRARSGQRQKTQDEANSPTRSAILHAPPARRVRRKQTVDTQTANVEQLKAQFPLIRQRFSTHKRN